MHRLGYPLAKRKYTALEVFLERSWDDHWSLQASYTWARSIGNTEGYVRSDNGQDDVQDVGDDDTGAPLSTYLHPRGFVAPRTVTFSIQYDF